MERSLLVKQVARLGRGLALASALAAAGAGVSTSSVPKAVQAASGPIVIEHWQHSSAARDEVIKGLAEAFNKTHKDVQVKVQFFSLSDFFPKLVTALASNLGPDTFQLPAGQVPSYQTMGVLQPLDPAVIPPSTIDNEFLPATMAHFRLGSRYYALPVDTQTVVLFYSPNAMERVGLDSNRPPHTWDELVTQARKIYKADAQGKTVVEGAATGGDGIILASLMVQAGSPLWDKATQLPAFNDPGAAKGFGFAIDLVQRYRVEDPGVSRWTLFRSEQLGFLWARPAMIGGFRMTPNLKFGVTEVPAPTPNGSQATLLANWGLVVSSRAPAKAASEWIKFVTSTEAERLYMAATGELPARVAELSRPEYLRDPLLRPAMASASKAVPVPWTTRRLDDEYVRKAWNLVLVDGMSPTAALEWLHTQGQLAEREERAKTKLSA